jgi:3-phosphoshikimate 1-carboxyvinyltransferase
LTAAKTRKRLQRGFFMKYIKPSQISGTVEAPPSKSLMQRAVIAASLADGESRILNPSLCDDALATMNAVQVLGSRVAEDECITVIGGGKPAGDKIDCRESGTCMRMMTAVAALYSQKTTITGQGSLLSRPIGKIEKPLMRLGVECKTNNGLAPVEVKGPMHGGKIDVDGSESSQFVSGLLMALPLCNEDSELEVLNLKSKPYVAMTESVMSDFGVEIKADDKMEHFSIKGRQRYKSTEYRVNGDWSAAAFMLVAGAIAGSVKVTGVSNGNQADEAVKKALADAGAGMEESENSITAEQSELHAFEFDASHCPDLFPPLAVLACSCKGTSRIHGVERLRYKESDRAQALVQELGKVGADIKISGNSMLVQGKKLSGGRVDSRNDHRIAMAAAVAALNSEKGIEIENEECVSKSYPGFFRDLEGIIS